MFVKTMQMESMPPMRNRHAQGGVLSIVDPGLPGPRRPGPAGSSCLSIIAIVMIMIIILLIIIIVILLVIIVILIILLILPVIVVLMIIVVVIVIVMLMIICSRRPGWRGGPEPRPPLPDARARRAAGAKRAGPFGICSFSVSF